MDDFDPVYEAIGGPFDGDMMGCDIGRKKTMALSWPIIPHSPYHHCYVFDKQARKAYYRGVIQAEALPELKKGT
jgi:hypothetical protein